MNFTASISTPNGNGTTLLIRPSLVTGLFTETSLTTTVNNATADVGIMVCVYVDPSLVNGTLISGIPVNPAPGCVVYDQRIQQVSNTLFGNLASCIPPPISTTACTADGDCPVGDTCVNPTGAAGAGFCQAPAPSCNFQTLLTTLSAHSFDFVVPFVGNGNHRVVMTWGEIGTNKSTTGGSTASCVGPAIVTVEQVKTFHNDSAISIQ
jgi:hypothetical protein